MICDRQNIVGDSDRVDTRTVRVPGGFDEDLLQCRPRARPGGQGHDQEAGDRVVKGVRDHEVGLNEGAVNLAIEQGAPRPVSSGEQRRTESGRPRRTGRSAAAYEKRRYD